MKKYTVRYWERNYVEREVMAESEQDAKDRMMEMVSSGELDVMYAEPDDCGCDVVNVNETEEAKGE